MAVITAKIMTSRMLAKRAPAPVSSVIQSR